MGIILVFHAKETLEIDGRWMMSVYRGPEQQDLIRQHFLTGYDFVAIVKTSGVKFTQSPLSFAYRSTNHIDRAWTENSVVEEIGPQSKRSTSIGDVMFHDGKFYVVSPYGFDEIKLDKEAK
jgi:hypothetical protein